jgi:hypothetical protein
LIANGEVYIREEAKTKRLALVIAAAFFMAGVFDYYVRSPNSDIRLLKWQYCRLGAFCHCQR